MQENRLTAKNRTEFREWLAEHKKMNATGGGAHSKEWMQMKADILNSEGGKRKWMKLR